MNLEVRKTYNFEVWPAVLLGTGFKACTVVAGMTAVMAQQFADIGALHAQVFPYLPSGTPNNPNAYDYVMVKTSTGQNVVLGYPWIKEDTIVEVSAVSIEILVTEVTTEDVTRLRDVLKQNGYSNFTLRTLN